MRREISVNGGSDESVVGWMEEGVRKRKVVVL